MKRSLIIGAVATAALLPLAQANAQVTFGFSTPEFGIQIGAPVYAQPIYAPVFVPPPRVFYPQPVYVTPRPVYVPRPIYVAPRHVYVAPRAVVVAPRWHPGYYAPRYRAAPAPSYRAPHAPYPTQHAPYPAQQARWVPPGHAKRYER